MMTNYTYNSVDEHGNKVAFVVEDYEYDYEDFHLTLKEACGDYLIVGLLKNAGIDYIKVALVVLGIILFIIIIIICFICYVVYKIKNRKYVKFIEEVNNNIGNSNNENSKESPVHKPMNYMKLYFQKLKTGRRS